jgi:hypothetical protein
MGEMENNLDGRKAVEERNREKVFRYFDERGAEAVKLGYHAPGMSRPTFRKHARAWCELNGQTMPRRGRPYRGKRRLTYMACLPGTMTQQEFENRRVPANERLGFNYRPDEFIFPPDEPRISKLPERDTRKPISDDDWNDFFEQAASSEPSVKTATDVAESGSTGEQKCQNE